MNAAGRVHWLIDGIAFEQYCDELVAAVEGRGGVARLVNSPLPPYGWDDVQGADRKSFAPGSCVVTVGDIDLVLRVRTDGLWQPGVFATVEHFYCSHYFPPLGRFLLNGDYTMLPFGDFERCAELLFRTFGKDGKVFVRPDSPLKLFAGLVVSRETLARDLEFMAFYDVPIEALVVVSSPKEIESEWRFVIADQTIVAGSRYKHCSQMTAEPGYEQGAYEFAASVLQTGFAPDPVWVMDVCRTADGKYRLLEVGGFSFSNLYGCDKDAVVAAVSETAVRVMSQSKG
jgi:hypothetical protein